MKIRDRIKELRRVRAGDLTPNPRNWRTHPQAQVDALRGIIAEIGYADALLARELPCGDLELIDGHARQELDPDQIVPVLVLDLDQDEALKLMTVLDPLAAMAEANESALESLLAEIQTDNEGVQAMLDGLGGDGENQSGETVIEKLSIQQPPAMSWVLIGIPTVRFGEIAEKINDIVQIDGTIIETTANDGPKN